MNTNAKTKHDYSYKDKAFFFVFSLFYLQTYFNYNSLVFMLFSISQALVFLMFCICPCAYTTLSLASRHAMSAKLGATNKNAKFFDVVLQGI